MGCECHYKNGSACTSKNFFIVPTKTNTIRACGRHVKPWLSQMHFECSICMESCDYKDACMLKCGHMFHSECLNSWCESGKSSCPLCRKRMTVCKISNHKLVNPECEFQVPQNDQELQNLISLYQYMTHYGNESIATMTRIMNYIRSY